MKASRIILIVVVIVLVAIIALYAIGTLTTPSANSTWHQAATYPLASSGTDAVFGQQCLNSTGYFYCIGGADANETPRDEVYTAEPISTGNLTGWSSGREYPQNIAAQACVAYSGYAYCVGGQYDYALDDLNSSYFASLSGGTLGAWTSTTPYPVPTDTQYCAVAAGHIFCVAGDNETDGSDSATPTDSAFFAPISSSGIGAWANTTAFPDSITFPSCAAGGGFMYCVGGVDVNGNSVDTDYYAALTSSGIGQWTSTTSYPISVTGQACAVSSGYIYCVGGETSTSSFSNGVYYATVSSSGIGAWKQAASYPNSLQTDCAVSSGYLYCFGGEDNSQVGENGAVYYASLSSLSG